MESRSVHIIDTTLRDGLQAPGLFLNYDNRRKIALRLIEAGIDEIEAGIPVQDTLELDFIRLLKKDNNSQTILTAWCRPIEADISAAIDAGADSIHISFPTSKRLMNIHSNNAENVLKTALQYAKIARHYFPKVSFGAQDACRADLSFIQEFVSLSNENRIWKVRIADTVGSSTPFRIRQLFTQLNSPHSLLEYHGHNDLGLALGNSLVALESGANAISATLLGIGERAGNTALEELIVALHMSGFLPGNLDLQRFYSMALDFSEMIHESIHPRKPICGSKIFTHESGIHTHGLLLDRLSYQPLLPEVLGRPIEQFEFGPSSGASNIAALFPGIDFSGVNLKQIAKDLRKKLKKINYIPSDAWIKTEINKLVEEYPRSSDDSL